METTLTALLHGDPGVGKSWAGASTPAPRLILDVEGRGKFTPGRKIFWDPRTQAVPTYDGSWDTCIVLCTDFDLLPQVHAILRTGQHPFVSATVDSLMMAQKRFIDKLAGLNSVTTPQWGDILRNLEGMVRDYHDLTMYPATGIKVVVFTVGEDDPVGGDGKNRPLLQGQLRRTVAYFVDVVGYMFAQASEDGQATNRFLLVHPRPNIVAKDNTGLLPGPVIAIGQMPEAQPIWQLYEYMRQANEAGIVAAPTPDAQTPDATAQAAAAIQEV